MSSIQWTSVCATLVVGNLFCMVSVAQETSAATKPKSSNAPLETVIVTGSPIARDPDFLATIVDSVDRGAITRSGGANLADALDNVPGVTGSGFAAGASRPVLRGLDSNRVRVLENGVGSFDVSDIGPDHGVPIDPLSTRKIEVVRGAATLRYGSQAIGGVVNAINDRVPTALPDKPVSGDVSATYGSNSNTRQGAALIDGRLGQFALHLDGFDRRTDDYDTPIGPQRNSFFDGNGYSAGTSYFFGENRVGVGAVHYDAKYGLPGEDSFIDLKQTKALLRSSFALRLGPLRTLNIEGGRANYEHRERLPDGSTDSTFKDDESDARAEALLEAFGPFSGAAFGVQLQRRDFEALGEGADFLLPSTQRNMAAFAFAETPLGTEVSLQSGARIERVDIEGTSAADRAVSRRLTPISVSTGVVFDATDTVRIGVTLASAARAPAQTELFARGPHDGPETFETGDPTLQIERANSLEGSLRLRFDRVSFDGSIYGTKFRNYIVGQLTGRTCDEEGNCVADDTGELQELNFQQLGARFYGLEGKAGVSLLETSAGKLSARLLADYVRAELDNGDNVPRIPPYHIGAGLSWDGEAIDGDLSIKYSGAQNETGPFETRTGGFYSLDAEFTWSPFATSTLPRIELSLIGHNLTDKLQRNSVSFNKDEVALPGRDVRLVIRGGF